MNSKVKGALVVAALAGLLGGATAGCASKDTAKSTENACKASGSCKAGGSCKSESSCGKSSCGK